MESFHTRHKRALLQTASALLRRATLTIAALVFAQCAQAQIIPDANAPGPQRPTVIAAPNGVPVVNIQTPSQAGVSRNVYSRFDIERIGAILNNSPGAVQTQLGGWVPGNPWLAGGPARIILNEVNSNDPSILRGALEVAGKRAQVVVANAAGIICDGCAFINASRATLTTGTPVFGSQGSLDGWRVTRGTVSIFGNGMNADTTDYADILARHVKVNAGLWAKRLNVVAGASEVKAGPDGVLPASAKAIAGPSEAPSYLVDVAELGGMYANHIFLVGREAGLGVRNDGKLIAIDDIALLADGSIVSRGTLQAGKNLHLQAASVSNTGLIDGGNVFIQAQDVENRGGGRIYGDQLAIEARTLVNAPAAGSSAADATPVIAARQQLDLGVGRLDNRDGALIFSGGDLRIGGAIASSVDAETGDTIRRAIGHAQEINNDSATIDVLGRATIRSVVLNNRNLHLQVTEQNEAPFYQETVVPIGSSQVYPRQNCSGLNSNGVANCAGQPGQPGSSFEDFTLYRLTGNATRSIVAKTAPSMFRVGGDLLIEGDASAQSRVTNQDSQIVVGGTTTLADTALDNIATKGTYRVDYSGTYETSTVESCGTFGRSHCREWHGQHSYNPAPSIDGIDLPTAPPQPAPGTVQDKVRRPAIFKRAVNRNYVIETDPAFTGYRNWLASDYLLKALQYDPVTAQKRLGDGYYEQKLLRDQVAQLTGRRFLAGYSDDETQYLALMNAGATFAKSHQLVPGVTLSAQLVAQLTSDIVWLVEQVISEAGPDGKPVTRRVLVPQLYARAQPGDVDASGNLFSSERIQAELKGDVLNSGTIAGRKLVKISAGNIDNSGTLRAAEVDLQATRDIRVDGGRIEADTSLRATAGRDLLVASTTVDSKTAVSAAEAAKGSSYTRTGLDRVASLYVSGKDAAATTGKEGAGTTGEASMQLAAGRDARFAGADVRNDSTGATQIKAGRDLNLATVTQAEDSRAMDGLNHSQSQSVQERGTTLAAQGAISLIAGQDLGARAATVRSESGDVALQAGRDLAVTSGQDQQSRDDARQYSSSGTFSSSTTTLRDSFDQTRAIASTVSGKTVHATAGRDLTVQGSALTADANTQVAAGRDVNVVAATETRSESHSRDEQKSGVFSSGGAGFTLGSRQQRVDSKTQSSTAAAATIGSVTGDVAVVAGQAYQQVGSDVLAPAGSVDIKAKSVSVIEARETARSSMDSRSEQSGITVAVSNPVITAVQTADQMRQAASNTRDSRTKALAAANVALAAWNAAQAVKDGQGTTINGRENQIPTTGADGKLGSRDATAADQVGGINIAVSVGSASSRSRSVSVSDTGRGSGIAAGQDVRIVASGAGADSKIVLQGSQVNAGAKASLDAEGDVQLLASRNASSQASSNDSASGSLGVAFGSGGLMGTASASGGKGQSTGSELSWTQARVDAGQQADVRSGRDTEVRGATVTAPKVVADVGGQLRIESLQDTSQFHSDQKSVGGSIAIGAGMVSGNLAYSKGKVDSQYAGVAEQSGIKAGDGGFDVKVAGQASLTGGVISSTERAVQEGSNRFQAQDVAIADVANSARYQANSTGINVGTAFDPSGKRAPTGTSIGIGRDSDSASNVTRGGISGVAGNAAARTGDDPAALRRIFDADRVQKEVQAQVQVTQTFGTLAPKAAAEFAKKQATNAERRGDAAEAAKWREGGAYRIALQAALGGAAGGAAGAVGAGAAAGAAPLLAKLEESVSSKLKEAGASDGVAQGASKLISGAAAAGLGAAATGGNVAGMAGALNVEANNRQLHPNEYKIARDNAKLVAKKLGITEDEAEGRIVRQLQRDVDGVTAQQDGGKRDEPIISILGCGLLKCGAKTTDANYWNPTYNAEYIKPNQSSFDKGVAQSSAGMSQQQIEERNNRAGAPIAKAGAVVLVGYVLAPTVAAIGTEVIAFTRNPVAYCAINPTACIATVEAAAGTAAGVPYTGVPGPRVVPNAGTVGAKGGVELVEGASSLIGANRAIIDPRKLTEYALNPAHPVGGNKARVFDSALGFTKNNADDLMSQLRQGVMNNTPIAGKVDQFGSRFTVDIPVTGPAGSGVVRSGWIYKPGSNVPEMTTIFVK